MHIKEFSVKGFKNLVQPVRLSNLGPINVIHGENNVGKSNVLEAIHLFFKLLSLRLSGSVLTPWTTDLSSFEDVTNHRISEIRNLERPTPVAPTP